MKVIYGILDHKTSKPDRSGINDFMVFLKVDLKE